MQNGLIFILVADVVEGRDRDEQHLWHRQGERCRVRTPRGYSVVLTRRNQEAIREAKRECRETTIKAC